MTHWGHRFAVLHVLLLALVGIQVTSLCFSICYKVQQNTKIAPVVIFTFIVIAE